MSWYTQIPTYGKKRISPRNACRGMHVRHAISVCAFWMQPFDAMQPIKHIEMYICANLYKSKPLVIMMKCYFEFIDFHSPTSPHDTTKYGMYVKRNETAYNAKSPQFNFVFVAHDKCEPDINVWTFECRMKVASISHRFIWFIFLSPDSSLSLFQHLLYRNI